MVSCFWFLVSGFWFSKDAARSIYDAYLRLANQKLETRNQKPTLIRRGYAVTHPRSAIWSAHAPEETGLYDSRSPDTRVRHRGQHGALYLFQYFSAPKAHQGSGYHCPTRLPKRTKQPILRLSRLRIFARQHAGLL